MPFTQVERQFRPFCCYCYCLYQLLPMTLNKNCIRFWLQVKIIYFFKCCINSKENTGNNMLKCKCCLLDLHKNKAKIRFVPSCKQEIRSNLGQVESKNPPWERIPQRSWTVGLRYTDRDELPPKLQRERRPVCDVIKQHFLEQPH